METEYSWTRIYRIFSREIMGYGTFHTTSSFGWALLFSQTVCETEGAHVAERLERTRLCKPGSPEFDPQPGRCIQSPSSMRQFKPQKYW